MLSYFFIAFSVLISVYLFLIYYASKEYIINCNSIFSDFPTLLQCGEYVYYIGDVLTENVNNCVNIYEKDSKKLLFRSESCDSVGLQNDLKNATILYIKKYRDFSELKVN